MLKKLLKYEWRATSRVLLPLYGSVIVMALINRLFWALGGDSLHVGGEGGSFLISQLPTAIASFVYGGLIVAS
ncbi:MAG: ABC transporter permease, partial [Intestinibacillus sp.]